MTTNERRFTIEIEDIIELYRMYAEDIARLYRLVHGLAGALTALIVLFVIVTLNIYATMGVI
jgi:hypothetical protein